MYTTLLGSYFERWIFLFGSWCVNTDTHIVTDPFNNGLVFDEDELMKVKHTNCIIENYTVTMNY